MAPLRAQGSRMATPITPTARGPSQRRTSIGSSLCSSPSPWRRTLTSCRCLMGHPSQRTCEPGITPSSPWPTAGPEPSLLRGRTRQGELSSRKTSVFMRSALNSSAFFTFPNSFLLLRSSQQTGGFVGQLGRLDRKHTEQFKSFYYNWFRMHMCVCVHTCWCIFAHTEIYPLDPADMNWRLVATMSYIPDLKTINTLLDFALHLHGFGCGYRIENLGKFLLFKPQRTR